jgi:hypothetical protein
MRTYKNKNVVLITYISLYYGKCRTQLHSKISVGLCLFSKAKFLLNFYIRIFKVKREVHSSSTKMNQVFEVSIFCGAFIMEWPALC